MQPAELQLGPGLRRCRQEAHSLTVGASGPSSPTPEWEPHSHPWKLKGWEWRLGKERFDFQLLFLLQSHYARHWGHLPNSPGGHSVSWECRHKRGTISASRVGRSIQEDGAEGLGVVWAAQEGSARARHMGRA